MKDHPDVSEAYWSREQASLAASLASGPTGLSSLQAGARLADVPGVCRGG